MNGNYIPKSEYLKQQDPLVCSVCGNEKDQPHCQATHCFEEAKTPYNLNPLISIYCNCPSCSFTI